MCRSDGHHLSLVESLLKKREREDWTELSSRKNSLGIIYQHREKYQTMEIVYIKEPQYPLVGECEVFPEENIYSPLPVIWETSQSCCRRWGLGQESFRNERRKLPHFWGTGFLRLDFDRKCWENHSLWGWGQHQGLVPAYGERLRAQRRGWGMYHQVVLDQWILNEAPSWSNYKLLSMSYFHFIIHLWECSLTLGQSMSLLCPLSRMIMR